MASQADYDRINFPAGFWAALPQVGLAPYDVLQRAGLPAAVMSETAVSVPQYFAIWQAYSDLAGDVSKGMVELVTGFETTLFPPSALATYCARDYRDALKRMARYKQLCPPERLRIAEKGENCTIELEWQMGGESGPPLLTGITLAYLLELGRRGTGQALTAQLVEFSQPMGDLQTLEAYFGCPVRIDARINRLTLRRRDLDIPFVSYNGELLDMLTPALDRSLDERRSSRSITGTVKWIIKRCLAGGRPDIQAVARELGISGRTLQRRLAEEGTSFMLALSQARHEQALAYLADASLDIKEVAFLLGYEDQNSFYRAFRLWEDDTPANWRTARTGHAAGRSYGG